MKEIIKDFVKGSPTEKLAIASNLSTILGVSIATFVAGPFLSEFANMEFVISDFIIAILFYFICLWIAADFAYSSIRQLIKYTGEKKTTSAIGTVVLALFCSWLALVIFPYAKYYTGNLFNNSYLLPAPAQDAIFNIYDFRVIEVDDIFTYKGNVNFEKGIDGSDYELVVYSKSSSGFYEIKNLANRDISFKLSTSGDFTIPINVKYDKINEPILVIYRNSDWSLFEFLRSNDGFPQKMTQLPSSQTEKIKAFVYEPKT
ncbi:hypothetical protein EA004_18010 [Vibrio anguillarum]|uniref:Uncharacterized protein n=1 Tax=Vibrio anguillarum TaxID=55601 RepID=A0ABR9Z9G7_VIBAN|nr:MULTISPECIES: hypothetical protein [Vibrio]MBF4246906.1 hypothetical protein [Vibrio anguillarum]MBF4374907.1 hypothetical protein [Vibrio anguillarum]TXX51724.1 hypothetical protein FXF14_02970 [Vibrio cholerae]HDV5501252.1 hypothetical protein [Vibrio cholerae]